jgi:hypothetical protein
MGHGAYMRGELGTSIVVLDFAIECLDAMHACAQYTV